MSSEPPAVGQDRVELQAVEPLLESVELPEMTLRGLAKHFGPGLLLMMTGVGTSHLVAAPVAGGRFEFALLWCLPLAYIFKFYGFEMAFRFTNATGRSLLDAYATAWRKWPLWYVMAITLIQCAVGQAGRLVAAAAVAYFVFTDQLGWGLSLGFYALVLGVASVGLLLKGRYQALELITKIFAGALFLSAILAYLVEPAPLAAAAHYFVLETPEGSLLIIAAFLGLLPTGIDVSLQASEWGKAKRVGLGRLREQLEEVGLAPVFDPFQPRKEDLTVRVSELPPHAREYCRRWFKIGLWDFTFGHVISFFIASVFLLLAAVTLYPSAVEGNAVIGEIAGMFTSRLGSWMMVVFLIGGFAALVSTVLNYFDGWPRVIGACARNLFRPTARLRGIAVEELTPEHRRAWYSEYNLYRITMLYSLVASVIIVAGLERPVWLVLVASALAFFIAPVIYFLNLYYCLTVIPKDDPIYYPSRFVRWFSWVSLVVFTLLTFAVVFATIFRGQVVSG